MHACTHSNTQIYTHIPRYTHIAHSNTHTLTGIDTDKHTHTHTHTHT